MSESILVLKEADAESIARAKSDAMTGVANSFNFDPQVGGANDDRVLPGVVKGVSYSANVLTQNVHRHFVGLPYVDNLLESGHGLDLCRRELFRWVQPWPQSLRNGFIAFQFAHPRSWC